MPALLMCYLQCAVRERSRYGLRELALPGVLNDSRSNIVSLSVSSLAIKILNCGLTTPLCDVCTTARGISVYSCEVVMPFLPGLVHLVR